MESAIPLIICLPFVVLLLGIAIMPLTHAHLWESNRNKIIITVLISLPVLVFLLLRFPHELMISLEDYISFILLLGALFILSGGIAIKLDLPAAPWENTLFLLFGAVLANIVGTTGASMLLIRPLLKINSGRKNMLHIPVFFIFIVSNIGGSLTPLGDPPLYLGYLRGVSFEWTLTLWPVWLSTISILLIIFYIWDTQACKTEEMQKLAKTHTGKVQVSGIINILLLLVVIATIFFQVKSPYRELVLVVCILLSLKLSKKEDHDYNQFSFHPIAEVAILFAGIFITMVPLLMLLEENGAGFGITRPWQFFWITGGLSSFLDNAPTYITLSSLAESVTHAAPSAVPVVAGIRVDLLRAISCGAVFMGANTYIGNGPNFMVKSIVEHYGVEMPHFFHYMLYSLMILIPVFLFVTFVFFMG